MDSNAPGPNAQDSPPRSRITLVSLDRQTRIPTRFRSVAKLKRWANEKGFGLTERAGAWYLSSGRLTFVVEFPT